MLLPVMFIALAALDSLGGVTSRIVVAPRETLTLVSQGAGPPIVLVHGLVGSAWAWRHVVAGLNLRGYRTIIIEPLGTGRSSRPDQADYSLTAQADRIASALDALGERHAIVVAHGLAGSMALRLAVRRPDLVAGVVSLEGGPAERAASNGFRRAMRYAPWVKFLGGVRLVRGQMVKSLRKSSGNPSWITDEAIEEYTAGAEADLDGTLKAYLRIAKATEPEQLVPRLPEIQCPVLLVVGMAEHEGMVGEKEVRQLTGSVTRFDRLVVAGAGHYLHEETPDLVVQAIHSMAGVALAVNR